MIKRIENRLLIILCLMLGVITLPYCEKDSEASDGTVVLLSFGPTGANLGDTLMIIGNNLQKVTAVELTGSSVDKANFKKHTSEEIFFIIPQTTVRGKITLKTPEGDVTSITELDLGVTIKVTSMTPEARPGSNVTITGTDLNWVKRITFAKDKLVTNFVSQSQTQLVVKVPDDAETGPLVIFYSGTDSAYYETKDTLIVTLPKVTGLAPIPIKHGQDLTITGTNLDLVKELLFNNESSPVNLFVSQSATQIVVKIPGFALPGKLRLKVASGVIVTTIQDLNVTLPAVTNFSPNPIKHATDLTITGTNLDLVKGLLFNNVSAAVTTFVSQSATQIVVKIPGGTKAGKLGLKLASGLTINTSQDLNLILPVITMLSPNPIDPLADLTITGTDFDLVTGISFVGITNPITTFISQTPTQLVVKVPFGALKGKVALSVVNCSYAVESSQALDVIGLPPLPAFPFAIYTDGLNNGFQNWSWAGNDFNSTAIVRQGTTSIKATYGTGGYEGITFHNDGGPALTGYTKLEFSIFGGPGTGGKKMNVVINGAYGGPPQVTISEGAWTTYSLNISSLPAPSPLKEIVLQSAGWSGVVHIDHVGLR